MSHSRLEQETILRTDPDADTWAAWTTYEPHARAWRRAGVTVVEERNSRGDVTGWRAEVPKRAVKVRLPRVLSPEQHAQRVRHGELTRFGPGHSAGRVGTAGLPTSPERRGRIAGLDTADSIL